ncbi:hypothetical protein DWB58_28510 [candidate division KSB1 bacterium]|nr:hypothetical protein [candidate division KSB1 bacterium]
MLRCCWKKSCDRSRGCRRILPCKQKTLPRASLRIIRRVSRRWNLWSRAPAALSSVPPATAGIATLDQLVDSLDGAIANFRKSGRERLTSALTVITGPSRTADIEKILVLGAHGPKRLAVILVG